MAGSKTTIKYQVVYGHDDEPEILAQVDDEKEAKRIKRDYLLNDGIDCQIRKVRKIRLKVANSND